MAIHAQAVTPDSATWAALAGAAGTAAALAEIQHRHRQGAASVLRIVGDVQAVVVVWVERDEAGNRELVLALGAGKNARAWVPWVIEFARQNRVQSIRTHCKRAGLIRLYQNNGFQQTGLDDAGYTVLRWHDGRQ